MHLSLSFEIKDQQVSFAYIDFIQHAAVYISVSNGSCCYTFVCIGSVHLANTTNHGVNKDIQNTKPVVIIFHPTAASMLSLLVCR